ncbi:MAG: hypothetical protein AAB391_04050 [Patescibacteria group bacterium]
MPKTTRKISALIFLPLIATAVFFSVPFLAEAAVSPFQISAVNVEPVGDFVLEPGKIDVYLEPGETVTRTIFVTNRNPRKINFRIETEDIEGNRDPINPVTLLGEAKGPYPFKDALLPAVTEFELDFGQKIAIPIQIKIPLNASPGGHYAAVIISNAPSKLQKDVGGARVISRLGALFFVRVKGEVKEEGQLKEVRIAGPQQLFYEKGPSTFEVLFENTGTVHLVPYGRLRVTNLFGETISEVPVDAYFSLPSSLRYREVEWQPGFLLGRYTASVELYRGYKNSNDISDTQTVSFWVIPKMLLLEIFIVLLLIVLAIRYVVTHFEFRKRKE